PANPDPLNNQVFQLYNLNTDFAQADDIAAANPQKVQELKAQFIAEAKKYQVFPLDASLSLLSSRSPRLVTLVFRPKMALRAGSCPRAGPPLWWRLASWPRVRISPLAAQSSFTPGRWLACRRATLRSCSTRRTLFGRKLEPAWRQRDGGKPDHRCARSEAARAAARIGPIGANHRDAHQSGYAG